MEVRWKEERKGRKEKAVLPGVMDFMNAVCLRLSSFDREEATVGRYTYIPTSYVSFRVAPE